MLRGMAIRLRDDEPTQLAVRGRLAERVVVRSEGYLMAETTGRATTLFITKSHHRNMSFLFLEQHLKTRRAHYIVMFKNTRNKLQISHLVRQMNPGRVKFVHELFNDATTVPNGYLLIDLKQETPDGLRLRTSSFPDGAVHYVYLPKVYKDRVRLSCFHSHDVRTREKTHLSS